MTEDLADWVRARPWVLVVAVSLLVLVGGSAVALSRSTPDDGAEETLAQVTVTPSATASRAPATIVSRTPTTPTPTPSTTPSLAPTPTPTSTPTPTPSATATATATTRSPSRTTAPMTARPTSTAPSPPTVTLFPTATATPSAEKAYVTIANNSGETISFQINGDSYPFIFDGTAIRVEFTVRSTSTFSVKSLLHPGCGESGTVSGLQAGNDYRLEVGSQSNGCETNSGTFDRPDIQGGFAAA